MYEYLKDAVPTRCDYTKTRPTIYKVPKELKRGEEDEGYEPVAVRVGPFSGSNKSTVQIEKGKGPVAARVGPFTWSNKRMVQAAALVDLFAGNNKSTLQLESYKWCCLRRLIVSRLESCSQEDFPQHDGDPIAGQLDLWLKSMKHLEREIRASYSQDIEHSSDGLAVIMLLDGCFILHRLLKYARLVEREAEAQGGITQEDDDWMQLFGRVGVWQLVASDLLLLENQIPFFVLSNLFELLYGDDEPKCALVSGSLQLFRSLCPHMLQRSASKIDYHSVSVHHLLHLFYLSITSPTPRPSESDDIKHSSCRHRPDLPDATRREAPRVDEHPKVNTDSVILAGSGGEPLTRESDNIKHSSHQAADVLVLELPQWIPCAKELEEAGVRFRKRKNAENFLGIEFNSCSGVLEIPPLELYDFSDKLFRNLIAFEQTYPHTRCAITTYAVFMDCLINTPEDMRILHLRGILVNQMNGEQDASRFFSKICAEVWLADDNYLKNLMEEVNKYSSSRPHKWRAELVRKYFSSPWVTMSALAAVLLLLMTGVQTFFTVYPYYNPPK